VPFWAKNGVLYAPFLTNKKFVEWVIWIGETAEDGAVFLKNMATEATSTSVSSATQTMGDLADDFQYIG
jgi:hypothetical protein